MDHSTMNLDMGELESPGNFEIEDCTRIIQASLTKILDTRCERRGPNLRKSLMVLRVIQRARTEQRNRYFSPPCSPSYAMDMSPSSQSVSANHQMGGGLFIPVTANYSQQLHANGTNGILDHQMENDASNCLPMSVDQADVENSNPSPRFPPINFLSPFNENIPHCPPSPPAEWISQSLEESCCRGENYQLEKIEKLYPQAMTSPNLVEPMEDDSLGCPLHSASSFPVSQSEAVDSPIDLQCKIANRDPERIIDAGMGLSLSEKNVQPANTDVYDSCGTAMDLTATSADDQLSFTVPAEDDDVFLPSLPSALVSAPETANQHRSSYGIPIKSSQLGPLNLTQTPILVNQRKSGQNQDHQFDFELNGDDCDEKVEPLVLANSSFGNIGEHLSAMPSFRKVREADPNKLPKQGFEHSLAATHDTGKATDKPIGVDTVNNSTTHFVDFDDDDDDAPPSIFHIDQSVDVTVLEPVHHSCDANKSAGELNDFVPNNFNTNPIEPIDGKGTNSVDGGSDNDPIGPPDMNLPADSTLNRAVLLNYFLAFGHDIESGNKMGHPAEDGVKKNWRTLNNQSSSRKRKIFRPHPVPDDEAGGESSTENRATPEPSEDSSFKKHKRSSITEESVQRTNSSEEPVNDSFSLNASVLSLSDSTPTTPTPAIYPVDKPEPTVNDPIEKQPSSPPSSSAISNLISMFSAGFHVLMESVSSGRLLTVGVHGVYESGVPVGHEAVEREPQVASLESRNQVANFVPFHLRGRTINTNDRPSTSTFDLDGHFDSFTESGRGGRGMIDEDLELGDALDSNSMDSDSHSPRFQTANFLSENSTGMVLPQELVCH